jgi:hypothetical protein
MGDGDLTPKIIFLNEGTVNFLNGIVINLCFGRQEFNANLLLTLKNNPAGFPLFLQLFRICQSLFGNCG